MNTGMSLKSELFSAKRLLLIIKVNNNIWCCTVSICSQLFDSLLASTTYISENSLENKDSLKTDSENFLWGLFI